MQARTTRPKIAVLAMACRFPQSNTLERFWDNLSASRDLISEVPPERWSVARYYSPDKTAPHKSYCKWGGFLSDIELFDAKFFGISQEDALVMDPQQRILLELTQELWERAGYRREEVANTRTAVYLGGAESHYLQARYDHVPEKYMKHLVVNNIPNMMSARISDFYDLKGTSLIIDTACSSSLVAVHHACRLIASGECDMAVAGGIDLLLDPYTHIGFSKAGVLSDDGRCYVFDERAKGFVPGEGAGLVLLKEYEAAVRDGDLIRGVILGSAVNNDGHTMGLTVPNQEAQKEAIAAALEESGVNAATISYLEAHGTGTLLGDPIEIRAATQVYASYTNERHYCGVGSVKSNMGHLLRAAGVAGLIKTLLALHHGRIPATLHCSSPHPRFQFDRSPFYPVIETKAWPSRLKIRRAAVSSFGFGGTNCHMVLEEAPLLGKR